MSYTVLWTRTAERKLADLGWQRSTATNFLTRQTQLTTHFAIAHPIAANRVRMIAAFFTSHRSA
jgi:hypothetical protein